jgi:hypothetical protein
MKLAPTTLQQNLPYVTPFAPPHLPIRPTTSNNTNRSFTVPFRQHSEAATPTSKTKQIPAAVSREDSEVPADTDKTTNSFATISREQHGTY